MSSGDKAEWPKLWQKQREAKNAVFEGNSVKGSGIGENVIREINEYRDVPAALSAISETISRIEAIAGDLEARLASVLADALNRPEGPLDSDSPRPRCALSVDLRNLDERLEVVWARLSMLLTRIEV